VSHQAPPGAGNPPSDKAVRGQGRHRRGPSSFLLPLIVVGVVGLSITAAWLTLHPGVPSAPAFATSQISPDGAAPLSSASPQPPNTRAPSTQPATAKPSPSKLSPAPTPSPAAAKPTPLPTLAKPTPTPSTAVSQTDRSVSVVVLNGTNETGLAVFVRQRLRDLGWEVVRIGNWRGEAVAHTTVFTNGNTAAVRTMWRDLHTGDRVRGPLPSMSTGTLVIVLAADYQR
jgi:hypothetical protein